MTDLGRFAGDTSNYQANAVSTDGSVIVGSDKAPTDLYSSAVFWRNGVEVNLKNDLVGQGVTTVAGWDLRFASGVSDDGLTICGTGIDPSGFTEAFVVTISAVPEAPSAALFGLGLLGGGIVLRRAKRLRSAAPAA